jgi:PQQ-like domain
MAYQIKILRWFSPTERLTAGRVSWAIRRRGIGHALAGAAVTMLVIAGWRLYAGWRMGRIELTTDGEPVVAQVLAEASDTAFGEPFDVAARAVVALPAGEYRLRVDGKGRLGRTYRFAVNRAETQSHTISIDEGRLLGGEHAPAAERRKLARDNARGFVQLLTGVVPKPDEVRIPIRFAPVSAALVLTPGKAQLIEWTDRSFICRDGASGAVLWDALHPRVAFDRSQDPARFLMDCFPQEAAQCGLVEPAPDLDGDGTGDLLLSLRHQALLVALSGKNGSMLWNHDAGVSGPAASTPGELGWIARLMSRNVSAGEPAIADLDGDGKPDLVATFLLSGSSLSAYRRIVVGISGRSGKSLWTHAVDKKAIKLASTSTVLPAVVVQGRQSRWVAYVDGAEWIGLDPVTGKVRAGPIDLGRDPITPVQHADLDGDGEPEIMAVGPGPAGRQRTVRALSIKSGREMWVATVDAAYDQLELGVPSRDRPLIADLDDDGRCEIVVADAGKVPPSVGYRGVRLIDGLSGATRWRVPMCPGAGTVDGGLAELVVAPDLDGDGVREVVAVSVVSEGDAREVYVDAISGKAGRRLWWAKVHLSEGLTRILTPKWWGRGPDGWPLLALPMGGEIPEETMRLLRSAEPVAEPIVHLLEASTGRERHRVTGLASAGFADLNGDGLTDLWGEVDGELRAFRGEAPEAWRALGRFVRPGSAGASVGTVASLGVDFDGDGIADTLNGGRDSGVGAADSLSEVINARRRSDRIHEKAGIRTAVARSGRDGHAIWKSSIDGWQTWLDPNGGHTYDLSTFPLPAGDLDGDGALDVIATARVETLRSSKNERARLPIEVLSGRTGARLWSAGALPLRSGVQFDADVNWTEPRVVEARGAPDLIVSNNIGPDNRLARVSGRDGRVVWDVSLAQDTIPSVVLGTSARVFDDLDGDGGIDAAIVVPSYSTMAGFTFDYTLVAVSLRDGRRLWSQALQYHLPSDYEISVGDIDGDKRPEVVAMEGSSHETQRVRLRVFDGRDGKLRWTWSPAVAFMKTHVMVLANFEGNGTRNVCVNFEAPDGRQVVVLDGNGKERAHRNVAGGGRPDLKAADLDGDGRDELLVCYGDLVHAWNSDLKELWCCPSRFGRVDQVVPASPGRPREVILAPGVGLDAATGQSRWTGEAPLVESPPQFLLELLDAGGSKRPPLLIGNGLGATVCRVAMPTEADGSIASPRGDRVRVTGRAREDARWARPLPWFRGLTGAVGPVSFLVSGGLALVNVGLPLLILRLATRKRRQFNIRTLMVLPLAAAVPLMSLLAIAPLLEVWPELLLSSERGVFLAGTLLGIPIGCYVLWMGASLVRRRWKPALALAGLTVATTLAIAGLWLWLDMKSMAAIERYGCTGWELVFLPGAYVAGVLWGAGWALLETYKLVIRTPPRDVLT